MSESVLGPSVTNSEIINGHLRCGLIFAAKGSYGTACLAAIFDHELSRLGFGARLGFTSCFDLKNLVGLGSMFWAIMLAYRLGVQCWVRLLLGHWIQLQRWVFTSGHVLARPINTCWHPSSQGDAASPMIFALYLWGALLGARGATAGWRILVHGCLHGQNNHC